MHLKSTIACALVAALSLIVPAASHPSAHADNPFAPPAACAPGDTIHSISSGVWSIEPSANMNPLALSAAQTDCYGFGHRPSDPGEARTWATNLTHSHYVVPQITPSTIRHGSLIGSVSSSNWTGYTNRYGDNGNNYYQAITGIWTVPTIPTNVSYRTRVSLWDGLGGDPNYHNSNVIWQAGEDDVTGPNQQPQFWYEDWGCWNDPGSPCPNSGWSVYINLAVHVGDSVKVAVNQTNGEAFFQNLTTGQFTDLFVSIDNNRTGYLAEWITEEDGCGPPPGEQTCTTFTNPNWNTLYSIGTTQANYFNIENYQRIDLTWYWDNNKVVAQPGVPNATTHGFSETCCTY